MVKTNVSLIGWSFSFAAYSRSWGHDQCACSATSLYFWASVTPLLTLDIPPWLSSTDSSLLYCTYAPLWLTACQIPALHLFSLPSIYSFLKNSWFLSVRFPVIHFEGDTVWYWCSWGHSDDMCTVWCFSCLESKMRRACRSTLSAPGGPRILQALFLALFWSSAMCINQH